MCVVVCVSVSASNLVIVCVQRIAFVCYKIQNLTQQLTKKEMFGPRFYGLANSSKGCLMLEGSGEDGNEKRKCKGRHKSLIVY